LGMPLNAFHRWGGQMPAHLIYLRDFRDEFFLDGVGAIGGGLGPTLEFLRQAVYELGACRILCYGFSVGGFAALYYGLKLHAARCTLHAARCTLHACSRSGRLWIYSRAPTCS